MDPRPGRRGIGGISVFSTALAYIFRILATAGATNLLLVIFLLPLSGMALGVMSSAKRSRRRRSPA